MKPRFKIDRGVRSMLIFSSWGLVLCCALMLLFSAGPLELVLLLLSVGLLCLFYRL